MCEFFWKTQALDSKQTSLPLAPGNWLYLFFEEKKIFFLSSLSHLTDFWQLPLPRITTPPQTTLHTLALKHSAFQKETANSSPACSLDEYRNEAQGVSRSSTKSLERGLTSLLSVADGICHWPVQPSPYMNSSPSRSLQPSNSIFPRVTMYHQPSYLQYGSSMNVLLSQYVNPSSSGAPASGRVGSWHSGGMLNVRVGPPFFLGVYYLPGTALCTRHISSSLIITSALFCRYKPWLSYPLFEKRQLRHGEICLSS